MNRNECCLCKKELPTAETDGVWVCDKCYNPEKYQVENGTIKAKNSNIIDLLIDTKFAESRSHARRLIKQGGVSLDGNVIEDIDAHFIFEGGEVLKVGKRKFARIT